MKSTSGRLTASRSAASSGQVGREKNAGVCSLNLP